MIVAHSYKFMGIGSDIHVFQEDHEQEGLT